MTDSSASQTYSVGIATVDITPPVGIPLCGFAARGIHSSTGIYHPLRAVATVIDDGNAQLVLVSAEIISFTDLTERIRTGIHQVTGLADANIILSATHTHCGPAMRRQDIRTHGRIDPQYNHWLIQQITHAVSVAWHHRFEARLRSVVGCCTMAMCRRRPDPDNPHRVLRSMRPYPAGLTDHDVNILVIESLDQIPRGILFNYACHPTSRSGLLIGGDYVAFAYDYLQECFPYAQPAFLQGCAGDQKPRPVEPDADVFGVRTVEQVQQIGWELGQAVEQAITQGQTHPVTGPLHIQQAIIDLETEPLDPELLQQELDSEVPSKLRWARYHLDRQSQGLAEDRQVCFEIQTVRIGDSLAMAALPGEMSVEHGLRLKKQLEGQYQQVMPLAYTNTLVGYVPSCRQFSQWGYEVFDANQYRYRTGRYVESTEDLIHSTIHNLLKRN